MGRKKIEIRPLLDERNRNVTFLKRKAGLMKKAWELSVLCGAHVSILIFANNGKPYEFSSSELDKEIDRYLDYEGLIERRRAPEFAAMAAAGEDTDEDEEAGPSRRGSDRRDSVAPTPKSLKGKETFKPRMSSRAELARAAEEQKDGRRKKRRREDGVKRSFVGEMTRDSDDSEEDEVDDAAEQHASRQNSSMQYAMNMHQQTNYAPYTAPTQYMQPPQTYQPIDPNYSMNYQRGFQSAMSQQGISSGMANFPGANGMYSYGQQWDQQMLARYAEFQLQQNHQRQQRALLERQRQQLAELGIPVDDKSLLDQIFGRQRTSTSHPTPGLSPEVHGQVYGSTTGSMSEAATRIETPAPEGFEWPVLNQPHASRGMHEMISGVQREDLTNVWTTEHEGQSPNDAERYAQKGLAYGQMRAPSERR